MLARGISQPLEARASSAPTFVEIYGGYYGHVSRWARALGAPAAARDDIVQDVFLVVHRRLADFDGENLQGWLYQITRRRVRDFRRLRWFRLIVRGGAGSDQIARDSGGGALDDLLHETRSPEGMLLHKEQAAILERLLDRLPEAQRGAFVLFEVDGYSGEEIARLQGVALSTVWGRIHKARVKLAADIERMRKRGELGEGR